MKIKKSIAFLIIVIVLLLSIFSSIPSQSSILYSDYNSLNNSLNKKDNNKLLDVELNIMITDRNGNVKKILKSVNKSDLDNLNKDLINKIRSSDLKYIEKFEYVLQKLKDNNLIDKNVKLEDIIDLSKFENESLKLKNVTNKNFVAHFSPTIVLGGGLGLGLGDERRLLDGFVHFFAVLSGAALVLCLDFLADTAYILLTLYFLPSFIGYMAGFTGIIMFAIYPGYVYMNLLMLGFVPFALWLSLPEIE